MPRDSKSCPECGQVFWAIISWKLCWFNRFHTHQSKDNTSKWVSTYFQFGQYNKNWLSWGFQVFCVFFPLKLNACKPQDIQLFYYWLIWKCVDTHFDSEILSFDWRVWNLLNQQSFQDMMAVKLIRVWTTFASSWHRRHSPGSRNPLVRFLADVPDWSEVEKLALGNALKGLLEPISGTVPHGISLQDAIKVRPHQKIRCSIRYSSIISSTTSCTISYEGVPTVDWSRCHSCGPRP